MTRRLFRSLASLLVLAGLALLGWWLLLAAITHLPPLVNLGLLLVLLGASIGALTDG